MPKRCVHCLRTLLYDRAIVQITRKTQRNSESQNPAVRQGYCTEFRFITTEILSLRTLLYDRAIVLVTMYTKSQFESQNPAVRQGYCTTETTGKSSSGVSEPCYTTGLLYYEVWNVVGHVCLRTLLYDRAIVPLLTDYVSGCNVSEPCCTTGLLYQFYIDYVMGVSLRTLLYDRAIVQMNKTF